MSGSVQRYRLLSIPPNAETLALAFMALLSSTISLKVASVQYLEFIELALLLFAGFHFLREELRLELSRAMYRLIMGYLLLAALIVAGCALAATRPFYLDVSGINKPGYVSAARLLELALGTFTTVLLTEIFRRSRAKCLFTAKIYFVTGTLSAMLSIVGFVLHGPFALFLTGARASGFYNEGGPYGLYMLSVVLLGLVFSSMGTIWKPTYLYTATTINIIALILSASKAAYIAMLLLFLVRILRAGSHRQRVTSAAVALGVTIVLLAFTDVSRGVNGYIQGGRRFEAISQARPNDVNFSYGRTAALFFVPRMVAQHPWLGVGFANYGLVRNAPEYRGSAAIATFIDHDGLGIPGLTAEIGIPATALLIYLLLQPAVLTSHLTRRKSILALALLQPLVHLCGAQLNVTYPWVISAIAIGIASMQETHSAQAHGPKRTARALPHAMMPSGVIYPL